MNGLQSLVEKYGTQLKELETRMAETKHKLEVAVKASRLLEEEGLSENKPPIPLPNNAPFPEGG